MEVLEILQKHAKDLLAEDFSLLETELDTGDYPEEYIVQCKEMIEQILLERKQEARQVYTDTLPSNILVDPASLIPSAQPKEKTPQEKLADLSKELVQMRTANNYKTRFKQFLANHSEVDEAFIDQHISLFQPAELDTILMTMQLSEDFLDKYFASLDADKIARYQLFSEKFFIRHYAQLDTETVLTKGKNEWRKKENRSTQLDVFLRLKGVKL